MLKIAWVLLPLLLYAAGLALAALRGRLPARMGLNVHLSLLLMAYLLATAGLGIFWVASQQLPVFDWHYLFGYATLLLLAAHLFFNLPMALRWMLRGRARQPDAKPAAGAHVRWAWLASLAAVALISHAVGQRQGQPVLPQPSTAGQGDAGRAAVVAFHEFSSESRTSVFRRAAGIEWGSEPAAFKRYKVASIALPAVSGPDRPLADSLAGPGKARAPVTLQGLANMLHLSAGVTARRGGSVLRAAPSSGGLFPSELYVLAYQVDGLGRGIYHYDPERHRLDRLGALSSIAGEAAAQAQAAVVVSAVFRRTGYKYHDRAYRYAVADAGHLLENLRLAAHGEGAGFALLPAFDEMALARSLGIDGVEEGVLSLALLNPGTDVRPVPAGPYRPAAGAAPSQLGVTAVIQQATSLQLDAAPAALPVGAGLSMPTRQVIQSRRSQRRFAGNVLPLAALSSALSAMSQRALLSPAVRVQIVVNRVEGTAPGIYRYVPGDGLALVRAGDLQSEAQSAALAQDVIGDAAAVLVLSVDRELMLQNGARGYRHAFIEAGMISERWLLAAVANHLGACPVGAFYDDEAAKLVGIDPAKEWVLHFAALGVVAD